MTIEKRLSIQLQDIVAVQFRCDSCSSILIQTGNTVVFKCAGCGRDWREREQQEYMITIDNFLKAMERLRKKQPKDPEVTIALEFKED